MGIGGSAMYAAAPAPTPVHTSPDVPPRQPLTLAASALVVASAAPLFGICTVGAMSALRGVGGLKWLSRTWERAAWGTFFASGAVLAVSRPLSFVAPALGEVSNGAQSPAIAAAETATRVCALSAGTSVLAAVAAERLGSFFGAALFVPTLVGSVATAMLFPDMPLSTFAPAPALVIPFLLTCSPPVFTRSVDLLVIGLWTLCAMAPALVELYPGGISAAGTSKPAPSQDMQISGDNKIAGRLAYEQVMTAMVLFWLHGYLLRRRPMCQY